jgi:thiol-disulfide isomerase/thioredoxin
MSPIKEIFMSSIVLKPAHRYLRLLPILFLFLPLLLNAETLIDIITEEDLTKHRVTLYREEEYFPLGGLMNPDGEIYNPEALQGRYVLLNLGASWCPFCGKEKPALDRLNRENPIENLAVLAVFLGEETGTVKKYLEENNYTFPAAVDVKNVLRAAYALRLPTSYILDKTGRILARINGNKEWDSAETRGMVGKIINRERGAVSKEE